MVRTDFLTLLFCFLALSLLQGQAVEAPVSVRKGVLYKNEHSFDIAIQTNGYYFGYNRGKINKYYLTKYLHLDLGRLKDSRESRINQNNISSNLSGNYIYGKQNDLWNLRVGRGLIRYYSEKARKKGVAVGVRMEGGLLLGILKPYYILVRERVDVGFKTSNLRFSEEKRALFLDKDNIIGASNFRYGLDEISFIPGAFGRVSLSLDPGAFEKMVRAINFGISVDAYSKRVPILVSNKNKFLFVNFFLNIQFGKRT